jgi:hypothetical protein
MRKWLTKRIPEQPMRELTQKIGDERKTTPERRLTEVEIEQLNLVAQELEKILFHYISYVAPLIKKRDFRPEEANQITPDERQEIETSINQFLRDIVADKKVLDGLPDSLLYLEIPNNSSISSNLKSLVEHISTAPHYLRVYGAEYKLLIKDLMNSIEFIRKITFKGKI